MKSYIWWTGDPWSAILALAALIIVVSIAGIAVVFVTYSKYKKFIVSDKASYIDIIEDQNYCGHPGALREYETQSLNIYVPSDDSVAERRHLKETNHHQTGSTNILSNDPDLRVATVFSSAYPE